MANNEGSKVCLSIDILEMVPRYIMSYCTAKKRKNIQVKLDSEHEKWKDSITPIIEHTSENQMIISYRQIMNHRLRPHQRPNLTIFLALLSPLFVLFCLFFLMVVKTEGKLSSSFFF